MSASGCVRSLTPDGGMVRNAGCGRGPARYEPFGFLKSTARRAVQEAAILAKLARSSGLDAYSSSTSLSVACPGERYARAG